MESVSGHQCRRCGSRLPDGRPPGDLCQECRLSSPVDAGAAPDETTQTYAAPSSPELPGQIGPYKILELLGEGGMGAVYLVEQEKPIRRKLALKVIKLGMDTAAVIARFESERQALAMMNHPNIAHVHDAGTTDRGAPYFVMEYVPGLPIADYCDKHRLNTRERLELFVTVCGAIQHAHQRGIIHRDIKPSNVLVTLQDGKPVPKIIDFGVAKATSQRLTEKTVFTQRGYLIGTPEYMSPEQAEFTGLDVDTTTDIYSLGVLLYELLVGALPFDSQQLRRAGFDEIRRIIREVDPPKPTTRLSSLGQRAKEIAHRRHTDVASLAKELGGDLDWITLKAMEKDRTRRYASSSEMAADIERHLRNEPVVACPPTDAGDGRGQGRRRSRSCTDQRSCSLHRDRICEGGAGARAELKAGVAGDGAGNGDVTVVRGLERIVRILQIALVVHGHNAGLVPDLVIGGRRRGGLPEAQ